MARHRKSTKSTQSRRVIWTDEDCVEAGVLGLIGQSTKMIQKETGLTACQIGYRLHKFGIRRGDFRNGTSEVFELVRASTRSRVLAHFKEMVP